MAAVPAVQVLSLVPESLAVFAFNAGAKPGRQPSVRRLLQLGGGLFAAQLLSALVYAVILGRLILLVYGQEFRGAIVLAMALLPGLVFQGCTIVADGYLRGRGRPGAGIAARLAGAGAMLLAATAFYGPWPALAVPLAASVGNAVSAVWICAAILLAARRGRPGAAPPAVEETLSP